MATVLVEDRACGAIDCPAVSAEHRAVEGQQREGRGVRVASEGAESERDDPGIDGGGPGGRAGLAAEGGTETVSVGQRVGDAADLPSKAEVGVGGAELVRVRDGDVENANDEADEDHPTGRVGNVMPSVSGEWVEMSWMGARNAPAGDLRACRQRKLYLTLVILLLVRCRGEA